MDQIVDAIFHSCFRSITLAVTYELAIGFFDIKQKKTFIICFPFEPYIVLLRCIKILYRILNLSFIFIGNTVQKRMPALCF